MKCPSCGYQQRSADRTDCEACGLIFAKWAAQQSEKNSTFPAALPAVLEIRGNIITGYYWWDFFLRQFGSLIMIGGLYLIVWLKPHNIFWYNLPFFFIVLSFFLSLAFYIPRKIAVFKKTGLEFVGPLSWALFFPRWHEAQWANVINVRKVNLPWLSSHYIYQVLVDVRIPGEEKIRTFGVRPQNGKYLDFLKYLSAKVDPLKIDPEIRELLKPEKLKVFMESRARGIKYGTFLVLGFGISLIFFGHSFSHPRFGGLSLPLGIPSSISKCNT